MNWHIHVVDQAKKQIKRLPKYDAVRIEATIDTMALDPFSGDIEKIKVQDNAWRRRVGAYRILYELLSEKRAIFILDVRRRTSTTY